MCGPCLLCELEPPGDPETPGTLSLPSPPLLRSIPRVQTTKLCYHVERHARATLQYPGPQGTYGGGVSVAPENSKNSNTVSPGSQVPHKAFFSPNQPSKVSCLLCSVDLLVVFRFLETENCKRKILWTKVATDATSKRHKSMKASKRLLKYHVTFWKFKSTPKPFKTACCHKPFRSKGLSFTKTIDKQLQNPKTSQFRQKLHKTAGRPLVQKLYHNTIVRKSRYLLSSSVKAPKRAKTHLQHFATIQKHLKDT